MEISVNLMTHKFLYNDSLWMDYEYIGEMVVLGQKITNEVFIMRISSYRLGNYCDAL